MPLISLPEVISEIKLDPNAIVLVPSTILKTLLSQIFRPEQLLLTTADVAAEVVHIVVGKPGAMHFQAFLVDLQTHLVCAHAHTDSRGSEIAPWFYPFPAGCTRIFRPPPVAMRPAERTLLFLRRARSAASASGTYKAAFPGPFEPSGCCPQSRRCTSQGVKRVRASMPAPAYEASITSTHCFRPLKVCSKERVSRESQA